jgi:inorganic pyrophosphatase
MNDEFWEYLQELVDSSYIVSDRPKGVTHHRYPNEPYPVDYGYLKATSSMDGGGVDIWVGSLGQKKVIGVLCTVDLLKRDAELKILYDCTQDEIESIMKFVNVNQMRAIFLERKK